MVYYVYKITNLINGKIYVGKRGHKDPLNDSYMGSGKLIKAAIKKYGKDSFKKEILNEFETNQEAASFEASLVTKELIESGASYNMHEGGHGGFMHINNLSPDQRVNLISLRNKITSGELALGGTKNWSESSYEKVREQGKLNRQSGKCARKPGFIVSEETRKLISENNHSNTFRWVCSKENGPIKVPRSEFRTYLENGFQKGKRWKTSSTTGTMWINDGINNKLIHSLDNIPEGWYKGRIMNMMVRSRP